MGGKPRESLLMLCLCIAIAVPLLPSLQGEFTNWDDRINVTENKYVLRGFGEGLIPLLTHPYVGLYAPVTYAFYWAQYHIWGKNPFAFHLANLLLHLASAAMIYLIIKRYLSASLPAAVAVLWWGVHPLNVEPVAWVTGLKDTLSTLLMLVSLRLYIAWRDSMPPNARKGKTRHAYWVFGFITFMLACLSKPSVAALPLLLIGYDILVLRRKWRAVLATMPYLIFSFIIIFKTMSIQTPEVRGIPIPGLLGRLRVAGDTTLFYLAKMVWPMDLTPIYARTVTGVLNSPLSWLWMLIAMGIVGTLFLPKWRGQFGVMIFLTGIGPVSGLIPFAYQGYSTVADRYAYFSLAGVALVLGALLMRLGFGSEGQRTKWGNVAAGGMILWSVLLGAASWNQTKVWQNSFSLWEHVLRFRTDCAEAYTNHGVAVSEKDDLDAAIADYERALEIKPKHAMAYYNLGNAWGKKNAYRKALDYYDRALKINPLYAEAYSNRGNAWRNLGEYDRAILDYSKALDLEPDSIETYCNRAVAWGGKGDLDKKIADCNSALRINPRFAGAYCNRGAAYADKGNYELAIKDCTHAIELQPDMADAYYNRGNAWLLKGDNERAGEDFRSAIKFNPDFADAYNNLANAVLNMKDYDLAAKNCTRAIELNANHGDAYYTRAVAYYYKNMYNEAWADIEKARKLGAESNPVFIRLLSEASGRME